MLSKYVWNSMAQENYLRNIGRERTDTYLQKNNLRNVVLPCLGQHCTKQLPAQCRQCWRGQTWPTVHSLVNVVQIRLRQNWTIQLLVQCWHRKHSHLFAGKITIYHVVLICLSQHCTKKTTRAMLTQSRNNFAHKNNLHFFQDLLGQHCIRKLLVGCSPMARRQLLWENNLYNVVSTMLEQHCIEILFNQCCPNTNVSSERTDILSLENRLFQICLAACCFLTWYNITE